MGSDRRCHIDGGDARVRVFVAAVALPGVVNFTGGGPVAGRVPWLVTSRAPSVHAPLAQTALAMAAARAAVTGTTIITIAELLARPRVALHRI